MPFSNQLSQLKTDNRELSHILNFDMYLIYTAVLSLGLLVVLPYYAVRFRKYMPTLGERLGFVPATDGPRPIWIHAVSVGEFRAVGPLIRGLRSRRPGQPILVSTTTPSGRVLADGRQGIDRVVYFPLDLPGIVGRTLNRLRPEMVIMAETEIWPNFLRACARMDIPVFMVNGRISNRSFRRYRLVQRWLGRVLDHYRVLGMQSEGDAARIREIGAPNLKVRVFGNLKYDGSEASDPLDDVLRQTLEASQPLMIAASTARGEESLVIDAFRRISRKKGDVRLLIAPRRAEQFAEVCRALDATELRWCRRSSLTLPPPECEVVVLDTIGELGRVFELASVVFMGGTLVPRGGHNILEPARFGKPVLFGPYMDNFRDMAREFLARGAAIEVRDSEDLADRVCEVLETPQIAINMTTAARSLLAQNAGATTRALDAILESAGATFEEPADSHPVIE